jgi:hypothetical protein
MGYRSSGRLAKLVNRPAPHPNVSASRETRVVAARHIVKAWLEDALVDSESEGTEPSDLGLLA